MMHYLSVTLLALLLSIGLSLPCYATNVILLVADDGGYAEFGFQQAFVTNKTIEFSTPNLDALSAESVVFRQGYVVATVCSPSRAGFLSGRYQQRFGYEYNISNGNVANDGMPTSVPLVFDSFKAAGHTTASIGKWHIGREQVKQPQNRNVDFFYGLWGGSRPYFQSGSTETTADKRIKRNTTNITWWSEASFNSIPVDTAGKGRHLTDAFGDEASVFIRDHASDPGGFFLYVPFTSPHGPYDLAKKQDMDLFNATSFGTQKKKAAALIYALDRAVGLMVDRLKDPNGDGNPSDSIYDETAIAFFVDNGGASSDYTHDNTPLRGHKSNTWEGGIRVPFFMKLPGVSAGIYDHPVTSLDATASLLAAAGADPLPQQDGVDLHPYLTGANTNAPHELLYWRQGEKWAIRQGDWKLCKGNGGATTELYRLNADGTGENVDRATANPDKVTELERLFTAWDQRNVKPRWSTSAPPQNTVDRFQFRPQDNAPNWTVNQVWSKPDGGWQRTKLSPEDAFANAVLQFPVRDDMSYTSNNNMTRQVGLAFMLNKIRLAASANGTINRTATLGGNRLLMTRKTSDELPSIDNQSTVSGGMAFTFFVDMDLQLADNLLLNGEGQALCHIRGNISDYYDSPRDVTKSGSSTVALSGTNSFGGTFSVTGGTVNVVGGEISGVATVRLSGGTLSLSDGLLRTPELVRSGGDFSFTGGRLETLHVDGNLTVAGGTFAPGQSLAATSVVGSYTQAVGGTLALELGGTTAGTEYDQMTVSGAVALDGTLAIQVVNSFDPQAGDRFVVMTSPSITGGFAHTNLPPLGTNLSWLVLLKSDQIELRIASPQDTDGDALDDTWELTYFPTLETSDGGQQDSDGDQFSDVAELLSGTDPDDPASRLQVEALSPWGSGDLDLVWQSVSGKHYRVQENTNYTRFGWQTLRSGILSTGPVHRIQLTDPRDWAWLRIELE